MSKRVYRTPAAGVKSQLKKDPQEPEQKSEQLLQSANKQPRPKTGVDIVVKKDLKKKIQKMISQSSAATVNISLFDGACQYPSIDASRP